jgi:acetyl esterase/lipase
MKIISQVIILFLMSGFTFLYSWVNLEKTNPKDYVYVSRDSLDLKLFVFIPHNDVKTPNSAIVIFHGGGWTMGEASWAFPLARHFAELGITSISVQYRLSDEKSITPLDAMTDACDAIGWIRNNAKLLSIDPRKIAAYGWSAGGHLAVSAAIFNKSTSSINCSPDALILESPAVSLLGDRWPRHLLLNRDDIRNISPDEHVREGLPPTLILQGDLDTVTPLAGAERFHRKMLEKRNYCELKIYKGFGHLFTPASLPDNGRPNPDPEIRADARKTSTNFLREFNFIK